MKRALRPGMEPLEGKALLSGMAHAAHVARQAPGAADPGLTLSLSTDHRVYTRGEPVVMTLTETNATDHPITVDLGPSTDGFYATQRRSTVWRSNGGIQPMFVLARTIPPHESITLTATWDGRSDAAPTTGPTGVFVVHSQVPNVRPVAIRIQPGG